jgi:hypothetical protein
MSTALPLDDAGLSGCCDWSITTTSDWLCSSWASSRQSAHDPELSEIRTQPAAAICQTGAAETGEGQCACRLILRKGDREIQTVVQNLLRNIHTLVFGVAGAGKRAVLSPIDDGFRFRAVPYSLMPSSVLLCCPLILLGFEFKKLW